MALCFSSVGFLEPSLLSGARRPTLDYFPLSQPSSAFCLSSASTFEGHSEASDVLRELFKVIQVPAACQAEIELLCDFQLFSTVSDPRIPRLSRSNPVRNSAIMANTRTPMKRARSTQLLNLSNSTCSGLGLDSGRPRFQAGERDQTLGLRSVVPLA